ncbi:MAG: hypothetical protein CM15mV148_200 [uncultured marine virus]|nr:MAG: hypothetical protein CM15mV148_200 [uncultured marine virus]
MVCQMDCQLLYTDSNRDTGSGLLTSHGHGAWCHWNGIVGMGRIHVARQVNHRAERYLRCHPAVGILRRFMRFMSVHKHYRIHCLHHRHSGGSYSV